MLGLKKHTKKQKTHTHQKQKIEVNDHIQWLWKYAISKRRVFYNFNDVHFHSCGMNWVYLSLFYCDVAFLPIACD